MKQHCQRCGQPHPQCNAHNNRGTACGRPPRAGADVCDLHGGKAPLVMARATIRTEALRWVPGTPHVDPAETLLRLLTQGWSRAGQLAERLEQLVDEHGGDLATAMIGDTFTVDDNGRAVKVGEYIRGLATLEAAERERVARWSTQAIAAGLAKRQVELAERQGALLADVLRAVLGDPTLGLTLEQRHAVPGLLRTHLAALPSAG